MLREAPNFAIQADFMVATFISTSSSLCTELLLDIPLPAPLFFSSEISYLLQQHLGSVTFPLVP